jgi:diacylglycerol kinase family enzyme
VEQEIQFFINDQSGKGEGRDRAEWARSQLPGLRISSQIPTSGQELAKLCSQLKEANTRAAVVFGGDGTVNYAIRGLIESGIPLFPYPSGTANDLANEHGITGSTDQLTKLLDQKSIHEVNLLSVNGIPFSTVAGIGIGSYICDEFNRLRQNHPTLLKASGRLSCEIYSLLAVKRIISSWGMGHRVRISSDEFSQTIETSVLMICNQSKLAGNLTVAPDQTPHSKTFTILHHQEKSGFSTLKSLLAMKLGRLNQSFKTFKTEKLVLESLNGEPLSVFGDGEILTSGTRLEFMRHPKKLRIFSEGSVSRA